GPRPARSRRSGPIRGVPDRVSIVPGSAVEPFVPPPYPYDRLAEVVDLARRHPGGAVDLSIGTPCDAPAPEVVEALASSGAERGYPASIGSAEYRQAASGWMSRRLGADVD